MQFNKYGNVELKIKVPGSVPQRTKLFWTIIAIVGFNHYFNANQKNAYQATTEYYDAHYAAQGKS